MFNLLEKCHNIRRDLCNGLKDEELNSLQVLFEHMGGHLNKTFVDLRKQEQLIDEMKLNLTNIRCKCIQMFRQIHYTNTHIRWLNRKIEAAWGCFNLKNRKLKPKVIAKPMFGTKYHPTSQQLKTQSEKMRC